MGSWFKFLMLAIQYGPKVYSLVGDIVDLIKLLDKGNEQDQAKAELEAALDIYKQTKNGAHLRSLRTSLTTRLIARLDR